MELPVVIVTAIAVPCNTVFGLAAATAIARRQFRGKALVVCGWNC